MLKGKNLLMLAGIGVLGYFAWKMYSKKKESSTTANFTGDLGIIE